jgi:hypothetical protein
MKSPSRRATCLELTGVAVALARACATAGGIYRHDDERSAAHAHAIEVDLDFIDEPHVHENSTSRANLTRCPGGAIYATSHSLRRQTAPATRKRPDGSRVRRLLSFDIVEDAMTPGLASGDEASLREHARDFTWQPRRHAVCGVRARSREPRKVADLRHDPFERGATCTTPSSFAGYSRPRHQ